MPDPSLVTGSALDYLDDLPSVLVEDPDVIAVAYALSKEADYGEALLDRVQANLLPATVDDLTVAIWEALYNIAPGSDSLAEREETVAARDLISEGGSGASWFASLNRYIGAGAWTYVEHVPGYTASTPGPETIRVTTSFDAASDAYRRLREFLDEITPANIEIDLVSLSGFALDVSQLDEQTL